MKTKNTKKYITSKKPHLGTSSHGSLEMVVIDISLDTATPQTGKDEKATIDDITGLITNFLERAVRSANADQRVRISRAGRDTC
jgi:hypothetical protein